MAGIPYPLSYVISGGGGLCLIVNILLKNKTSKCLKNTHYDMSPCSYHRMIKLSLRGKFYTCVKLTCKKASFRNVIYAPLRRIFLAFLSYLVLLCLSQLIKTIYYSFICHKVIYYRHKIPLLRLKMRKTTQYLTLSNNYNIRDLSSNANFSLNIQTLVHFSLHHLSNIFHIKIFAPLFSLILSSDLRLKNG